MGDETKVMMKIPQDVISAQVQAAVADVLMERGPDFVREIVSAVIDVPHTDRYGREETRRLPDGRVVKLSKFQMLLEKGVADAANEEAKVWIEEQKGEIKKAVRAHLGRTKKDVIAKIADGIIENLSEPRVFLRVRFGDDE